MKYEDFELEVRPLGGREYELVIIRSPGGEARERATLPFSELQLKNHLLNVEVAMLRSGNIRRMALTKEEQAVQDFGRALFDFLFPAELRSAYRTSLNKVHAVGDGLRVKLRLNDPKLAFLPWEFLFDSSRNQYICLSTETPIVRYLEIQRSIPPLSVKPPLRILGMVVNPKNYPQQLDVVREKQRVEEAVKELQEDGLVELHWLNGQTYRDLQRELRRGPWHIFHFIGHGSFDTSRDEGRLIFADQQGNANPFGAANLASLLVDHKPLRLALLNACEGAKGGAELFSGTAPILVSRGLPAVIAMQYAITDRGAIEFARAFYESLVDGYPVDASMSEARKAMSFAFEQTVEWGVPVLYMRAQDGVLFDLTTLPSHTNKSESRVGSRDVSTQPVQLKLGEQPEVQPNNRSRLGKVDEDFSQKVLNAVAQTVHKKGFTGIDRIAEYTDLHNELVEREVTHLQVKGLVTVTKTGGKKGKHIWTIGLTPLGETQVTIPTNREPSQSDDTASTKSSQPRELGVTKQSKITAPQPFDGIEWIEIPAGEFWMGAAEQDKEADDDEKPLHKLYLPTYWMAKTPITNGQYLTFVKDSNQANPGHWKNGRYPDGKADHPVVNVSWEDGMAYCQWLSQQIGMEVILPSEAEWEKAARGTADQRIYPWGDEFKKGYCNNSYAGIEDTSPVAQFKKGASPYGVWDMSGNVWEWTHSIWGKDWAKPDFGYPYKPDDGREDLDSDSLRVLRGGSFHNFHGFVRVSSRYWNLIGLRASRCGFRVVVRPPSQ